MTAFEELCALVDTGVVSGVSIKPDGQWIVVMIASRIHDLEIHGRHMQCEDAVAEALAAWRRRFRKAQDAAAEKAK